MVESVNQSLGELIYTYYKNPLAFIRDAVGITLSEQQKELFLSAIEDDAFVAVKSATGTGKTTTLALIVLHQLLTEKDVKIVATSPSAGQLARGLRAEIGKMHRRIKEPLRSFYRLTQEKIVVEDDKRENVCSLVTGSAENKESLAGVHAEKVLILVDEASSLEQEIYDTLVGNLTTAGSMILTSNPVRSSGAFYDLFTNERVGEKWKLLTFTAFDSPMVSEKWIDMIEASYGKDSDFYKMRVLGEFAIASDAQFIPADIVDNSIANNLALSEYHYHLKSLGVDCARFGDDKTVLVYRQGRKVIDIISYSNLDTMEIAQKVAEFNLINKPDVIFIDGIGIGAGVVDRCKQLNLPIRDVIVSQKSTDPLQYFNLRSQLWGKMKEWLANGSDIPSHIDLRNELIAMQYGFNLKLQIQLMSKKDLKKTGVPSPDHADALALTFYDDTLNSGRRRTTPRKIRKTNYCWV